MAASSSTFGSYSGGVNLCAKLMVNPLIILNMGAEMIYILQQRLKAQKIAADKSSRVLLDTVCALFDVQMIESMFQQQAIYESTAVRQVFHQITHSSIMRLNDQSMDKLYDLMLMGLKLQLIACRDCHELIESTLNHIDNVFHIIRTKCCQSNNNNSNTSNNDNHMNNNSDENREILDMIASVRQRVIRTYVSQLSASKIGVIRQYLFQWLQDRNIKVSILLQRSLQALDGHIITYTNGVLPKYAQIPGQQQRSNDKQDNTTSTHDLMLPNAKTVRLNTLQYTFEAGQLHTEIGHNLYAPNHAKASKSEANSKAMAAGSSNTMLEARSLSTQNSAQRSAIRNSVKHQLDDLSSMLNVNEEHKSNANGNSKTKSSLLVHKEDVLKLDLFHLDIDEDVNAGDDCVDKDGQKGKVNGDEGKKSTSRTRSKRFGRATSSLQDALDNLDLDEANEDVDDGANGDGDGQDLLALLNDDDQ